MQAPKAFERIEVDLDEPDSGRGRRRHPRKDYRHYVGVLSRGIYGVEYGVEISEGGMLLASRRALEEDPRILITLSMSVDLPFFLVSAKKVYQRDIQPALPDGFVAQYCYGLEFQSISFEARRLIRSYVAVKVSSGV